MHSQIPGQRMQTHTNADTVTNASPLRNVDAARAYAQRGWAVLPLHNVRSDGLCTCGHNERVDKSCECGNPKCQSKHGAGSIGKHPLHAGWQKTATTDPAVIASWQSGNIGVATGAASGVFVVDVDPRNGGLESLAQLEREHGPLPRTTQQTTGSGGTHYIFKAPSFPVTNSSGKIAPGIDIKGNNGQIVVWPSVSGRGPYTWINAPWDVPPADPPAWLLERLGKAPTRPTEPPEPRAFPPASRPVLDAARRALADLGPGPERINGEGGGEHTVKACALLTHDFALSDAESWELLLEWNETRIPPWDLDELRERLRRGRRYGKHPYGCRRTMDTREQAEKLIIDWQSSGSQDPMPLIDACRDLTYTDRAERAHVSQLLKAATGIGVRDQQLPEVVDLQALAEKNERRRAYESGADSDLIDPAAPLDTARRFLAGRRDADGYPDIRRWQGEFYQCIGAAYEPLTDEAVNAQLYRFADGKREVMTGVPVKPDRPMVETIAHALRAESELRARSAPAWINGAANDAPPGEIIAFPNGLLHVPTLTLQQPSRRFFTLNALGFPYEPNPPAPAGWLTFLDQLWPNDHESRETLQEFMGLALTGDTSHQKIFMLIGPKRSGKGTIARVLQALVGEANHCAPTLSGLGHHFGLESLIGKTLAVISDARLGGRTDLGVVTENLLRISGEDVISVPRKHRGDYTAKLSVRFLILSNEVPALLDQSGALASRFILLRLARSFFGQEDRGLTARLLTELPGIMHWAVAGLDRLRARGYFRQPSSAMEALKQLETLGSPIKAFVEERCELKPGAAVECPRLYLEWCNWAREQGRDQPGNAQIFGRNLSAAFPEVTVTRPRVSGQRERVYQGIGLVSGPRWSAVPSNAAQSENEKY